MAYDTPITSTVSTPQPPSPANGPSDWSEVVHANYFSNIERLGLWTGGTTSVTPGSNPSGYFNPVGAGSIGTAPGTIYVLVHGWAPNYVSQVPADGDVFWWSSSAAVDGVWPSAWAWETTTIGDGAFTVNPTGMLQSICGLDSSATALCYSWLDASATDSVDSNAYQSEASTHVNGIRLANALQSAIDPSFFGNGGKLHLIGHSHGSKVCTVATATLQQANIPVARLTILDSPESGSLPWSPLQWNAANLLGSYTQDLTIMDPSNPGNGGTFVEAYASYFGVMYAQSGNVVGVCLNPNGNGNNPSTGEAHTYAAGWFGASASSNPPVGLASATPPASYSPYLIQSAFSSTDTQFSLSQGASTFPVYDYNPGPLVDNETDPIPNMVLDAANPLATTSYVAAYPDEYGIAFDVSWASPQVGDYLVASVTGMLTYTLLVMDGQSAPLANTTVFINADVTSPTGTLTVYFVAAPNGPGNDQVTLSNFRYIAVPNAS